MNTVILRMNALQLLLLAKKYINNNNLYFKEYGRGKRKFFVIVRTKSHPLIKVIPPTNLK